jgi:hypothetical protein
MNKFIIKNINSKARPPIVGEGLHQVKKKNRYIKLRNLLVNKNHFYKINYVIQ